ncbi:hypothetical protein BOTBODRAFT_352428 [Botryobasidium botryosum FD-172 SS1]|uniref:Uncharacterized protein n=1 Tax=Botryobasidium botryosum (strain FD-172 SS1) TaxID=930990 RepID=A0A067MQK7_BOTB1|nr:hypothetical protein BOTBODRAFT_352428 [Botryobasidium botryosum FD-172 SS1]
MMERQGNAIVVARVAPLLHWKGHLTNTHKQEAERSRVQDIRTAVKTSKMVWKAVIAPENRNGRSAGNIARYEHVRKREIHNHGWTATVVKYQGDAGDWRGGKR